MKPFILPYNMNKKEINEIRGVLDHGIDDFLVREFGLASKEDYLEFRDDLKTWLIILADEQRILKAQMREPGNSNAQCIRRAEAQSIGVANARAVTLLIDIRQQAKHWAICQARNAVANMIVPESDITA